MASTAPFFEPIPVASRPLPAALPTTYNPFVSSVIQHIKTLRTAPPRLTILDYTRACQRGHLHAAFVGFDSDALIIASTLLGAWPETVPASKKWNLAIQEEHAYRRYCDSGELVEPLGQKVQQLANRFRRVYGVAISTEFILAPSSSEYYERLVGRAPFSHIWTRNNTLSNMAGFGEVELLKWATGVGAISDDVIVDIVITAAQHGQLSVLRWAHSFPSFADVLRPFFNGTNTTLCTIVASTGHLHVLRWLRRQGAAWNINTTKAAANNGRIAVLQLIHSTGNKAPGPMWSEDVFEEAVYYGASIQLIQWLHTIGCPWDVRTCYAVLDRGDLYIRAWTHKHGCPWDRSYVSGPEEEESIVLFGPEDDEPLGEPMGSPIGRRSPEDGEELTDGVSETSTEATDEEEADEEREEREAAEWQRYREFQTLSAHLGYQAALRLQMMQSMVRYHYGGR